MKRATRKKAQPADYLDMARNETLQPPRLRNPNNTRPVRLWCVPEEREVIKLAYRTHYGDIRSGWRDISHFAGETMCEGIRVEYAYAAPVVTVGLAYKLRDALDSLGIEITSDSCMKALTAALEPDNAN